MLARFASLLRLFQIRALVNSKLFCPEDVLKRRILINKQTSKISIGIALHSTLSTSQPMK